jgi:ribonuclease HI
MYFDGSKCFEGAGAGVMLISPQGDKMRYVLRMSFANASNNEAEYEALLHDMRMAKACGATRLKIFGDSNLGVKQVMNQCDVVSDNMIAYRDMYNNLEGSFDDCESSHISISDHIVYKFHLKYFGKRSRSALSRKRNCQRQRILKVK